MGLSKSEWETYISFMAEGQDAVIYSTDPAWIRKMKKLCEEHPENYQIKETGKLNGEEISITVICKDKGLVSVRGARLKLSEETKAKRAEQLRNLRRIDSEAVSLEQDRE